MYRDDNEKSIAIATKTEEMFLIINNKRKCLNIELQWYLRLHFNFGPDQLSLGSNTSATITPEDRRKFD